MLTRRLPNDLARLVCKGYSLSSWPIRNGVIVGHLDLCGVKRSCFFLVPIEVMRSLSAGMVQLLQQCLSVRSMLQLLWGLLDNQKQLQWKWISDEQTVFIKGYTWFRLALWSDLWRLLRPSFRALIVCTVDPCTNCSFGASIVRSVQPLSVWCNHCVWCYCHLIKPEMSTDVVPFDLLARFIKTVTQARWMA